MSFRIGTIVMLVFCAASPCFAKGVIRGTLHAPGDGDRNPNGSPTPGRSARGRYRDVVVYLAQAPEKLERKLVKKARKAKHRIVQEQLSFSPRVLAVAVGDTVLVENKDRVYHNTFSVSLAKRFDLGKYAPGHVTPVVFEDAGVVNLHCDIHPSEAAFVVAVPNHIFTRPDSLGRFKLPKLPNGSYTLKVWHPRLGTVTREVEMPKKGNATLDLEF